MTKPFPVILSPDAKDDLLESWAWLHDRNPKFADEWLAGIREMILGIGTMPEAHPVYSQLDAIDRPVRQALFGRKTRWRIYYMVNEDVIEILHVRHGRRSDWKP